MAPAGWYDDPTDPTAYRWWDGSAWAEHTAPRPLAPAPGWYAHPEVGGKPVWWDGSTWVHQIEVVDHEVIDLRDLAAELGEPVVVPGLVHHDAGWYADPRDADGWRWWDGTAWTEHTRTTRTLV